MTSKTPPALRTLSEVKLWFEAYGVSVAEWAKSRGFAKEVVYAVLSGRSRGQRGQAHQVAVALGIKPAPKLGLSPLDMPSDTVAGTDSTMDSFTRKDTAMSP